MTISTGYALLLLNYILGICKATEINNMEPELKQFHENAFTKPILELVEEGRTLYLSSIDVDYYSFISTPILALGVLLLGYILVPQLYEYISRQYVDYPK